MKSDMIIIPAIYRGSRDLVDKTKNLTFQTNEVTPKQAAELQSIVQDYCFLAIKKESFLRDQVEILENLKADYEDSNKTPGQRLRNTLYRLWQQSSEGYEDFNLFYAFKMEGFIRHVKNSLI